MILRALELADKVAVQLLIKDAFSGFPWYLDYSQNELDNLWQSAIAKPGFSGLKKTYLSAKDNVSHSTGCIQKGTWFINAPPKIISLTPSDKSTFNITGAIEISINAIDPDKDPLEYKYFLDDRIIQDWTKVSQYSFRPSLTDKGKHNLKIEVRDNIGGSTSKIISIYIFRDFPKPPNE